MNSLFMAWRWFVCCVLAALVQPSVAEYFAVCDAGSTGTRLYVFDLDTAASTASAVFVKKTKPGLSSYAADPSAAVPPLLKLLAEGAEKVPEAMRGNTSLSILGTAGMRLLAPEVQDGIWSAVTTGLRAGDSFPFAKVSLEARTVSGNEEGLWAVLTANFLTGRMSHNLLARVGGGEDGNSLPPVGLMDLGGSSTQIAVPSAENVAKGLRFDSGAVVHSYLGFGMTHIREQIRKTTAGGADSVCYMRATVVEDGVVGTGDGPACRKLISAVLAEKTGVCRSGDRASGPCLWDLAEIPLPTQAIKTGAVEFFAVAGMTYVADFVRWWLDLHPVPPDSLSEAFLKAYPRPTIKEFKAATDSLCGGDYAFVAARAGTKDAHPFTGEDNAPYRCFQANYIFVLLQEVYGFSQTRRDVTFALDVGGEDLEWPLGSLLFSRTTTAASNTEL